MSGIDRIAAERQRQIEAEGWVPAHDDTYQDDELSYAAWCYLTAHTSGWERDEPPHECWPWHERWFKPSDDPIRNLEKAGALIAAEIDRLLRAREADQ